MTPRAKLRTIEGVSGWLASCNLWAVVFMPVALLITGETRTGFWPLAFGPIGLLMLSAWWATKKQKFAQASVLAFANAAAGGALVAAIVYLIGSGLRDAPTPIVLGAALLLETAFIAFWLWAGTTLRAQHLTAA